MRKFIIILTPLIFFSLGVKSQIPTDSLQLYYQFDNNALDGSGNSINGTVYGPTITNDHFGNPNNAYHFDGVNDYIDVPNASSIKPDFPFAISLWFKIDAMSGTSVLYASDAHNGSYSGFWVGYNSSGHIIAAFGNGLGVGPGSRFTKLSTASVDTSSWHNLIISYNSLSDIDIYVDCVEYPGTYSGSASYMTDLGYNGAVGRRMSINGDYHDGIIDDIRIYNKFLLSSEIETLCNETNPYIGIAESSDDFSVIIFPNPVKDIININTYNSTSALFVKLYDLSGRMVMAKDLDSQNTILNVNSMNSGLYIVHVTDENGKLIGTTKVILE